MILEKRTAMSAVFRAAQLCQQVQTDMVQTDAVEKADRSPVTVADFGSQALICQAIGEAFPEDVIVAEEDSQALQENPQLMQRVTGYVDSFAAAIPSTQTVCDWIDRGGGEVGERFWTLDPIDGTKGFLRGDQYAIALALIVNGEVKLGVLGCPNLPQKLDDPQAQRGCLFVAERDKGTQMLPLDGQDSERIHISEATHRFAESVESTHSDLDTHAQIAQQVGIIDPPIRMDGQGKYGVLARGEASVYIRLPNPATPDYRECIWDHAAGMIVVEEAGGVVTDVDGQALDFSQGRRMTGNRGILATNGKLHPQLLECISSQSPLAVD
ncbi:3'(2'),5'-bisphosphate nucleotidase [Candidatus Poribacteria bacterium]|nr:MAG: 3'(2'),5'-bisphosphate nucleotidase [Candidatus Poribacteria bacterium]